MAMHQTAYFGGDGCARWQLLILRRRDIDALVNAIKFPNLRRAARSCSLSQRPEFRLLDRTDDRRLGIN